MKITRTTVLIELTRAEKIKLQILARQNKTTLSNYIRSKTLNYDK